MNWMKLVIELATIVAGVVNVWITNKTRKEVRKNDIRTKRIGSDVEEIKSGIDKTERENEELR